MQKLLNVIINTLECDGSGFIFMPEPCTYAPTMTGRKGKGELSPAELWTKSAELQAPDPWG